ncbi:unnamed protein product [Brassica rapa]|uniref:BnaA05g12440D protein n=2 Tax=Brassica TaxID=3705 RepID=A0A078I5T1_BRANA|nr:unnamed protein product [Brassica rapa]CDY45457.1 BnaA05g12440D [Brassica napus]VDC70780.1 unnamed protein product [Brassica rapa]
MPPHGHYPHQPYGGYMQYPPYHHVPPQATHPYPQQPGPQTPSPASAPIPDSVSGAPSQQSTEAAVVTGSISVETDVS